MDYDRLRTSLQGIGAAVGVVVSLACGGVLVGHLFFLLIGAIYGSFAAGFYHNGRLLRDPQAEPGTRRRAAVRLGAFGGAFAGFTWYFFLVGVSCPIAKLIASPFYAGIGGLIGAAAGLSLPPLLGLRQK